MKKFKFKLEKVLMQKNIAADIAQKDFGEAMAARNMEEQKLHEMIDLKNRTLEDRSKIVESRTDWASDVNQINEFLQGQDLRIKNQHLRLQRAENLVESRREILRQKVSEVKILEKLREKQKLQYEADVARMEQAEVDEVAVLRFSRNESLIKGSHEDGI